MIKKNLANSTFNVRQRLFSHRKGHRNLHSRQNKDFLDNSHISGSHRDTQDFPQSSKLAILGYPSHSIWASDRSFEICFCLSLQHLGIILDLLQQQHHRIWTHRALASVDHGRPWCPTKNRRNCPSPPAKGSVRRPSREPLKRDPTTSATKITHPPWNKCWNDWLSEASLLAQVKS